MARHPRDSYSVFAEDHRELRASKRDFSPTLRIKAIAAALLAGIVFWAGLFYYIAR